MTKEQLKQDWQEVIHQYETSGVKSQSEWCRENRISIRNFNRWYNKLKKQSTTLVQGWLPVQIAEKYQDSSLNLKIGNVNIEVKEGFQPSLLVEVVKTLGGLC